MILNLKVKIGNIFYRILNKILSRFRYTLVSNKNIEIYRNLFEKYSWGITYTEQKPINMNREELPWFTFPAIEYLSQIDLTQFKIYEWGSGNSSKYFARRCHSIVSIESDKEWYDYGIKELAKNQKIVLCSPREYAASIDSDNQLYDLIIIDSLYRYECAKYALKHLKSGGIIILDNSDWHPNTCKFLRESSRFIQVDFHGFGPINQYSWTTSLFFDKYAEVKPLNNVQPHYSQAAIIQVSDYDQASPNTEI
jgi:hypothetical protein